MSRLGNLAKATVLAIPFAVGAGTAQAADIVDTAIANVLESGLRTADIMQDGMKQVSTKDMGAAIRAEMGKLAA